MTESTNAIDNISPASSIVTTIQLPSETDDLIKKPENMGQILGYYLSSLIRASASQIYIYTSQAEKFNEIQEYIHPLLTSRVRYVDIDKKIAQNIYDNIFLPMYDEAEWVWKKEHNGESGNRSDQHEHTVCILYEFLRLLVLGHKYESEVDFDLLLAKKCVERLRTKLETKESVSILDRIEGIINTDFRSIKSI